MNEARVEESSVESGSLSYNDTTRKHKEKRTQNEQLETNTPIQLLHMLKNVPQITQLTHLLGRQRATLLRLLFTQRTHLRMNALAQLRGQRRARRVHNTRVHLLVAVIHDALPKSVQAIERVVRVDLALHVVLLTQLLYPSTTRQTPTHRVLQTDGNHIHHLLAALHAHVATQHAHVSREGE